MPKRVWWIPLILIAVGAISCTAPRQQVGKRSLFPEYSLTGIQVREMETGTEVSLIGTGPFDYIAYLQNAPPGLILEIQNVKANGKRPPVVVNNPLLDKISILPPAKGSRGVRVVIGMKERVSYSLVPGVSGLVALFSKVAPPKKPGLSAKQSLASKSRPASTRLGEDSSSEPVQLKIKSEPGRTLITVISRSAISRVETFKMDAPARLISDIWGLTLEKAKSLNPGVDSIKRIRLAPFRDRARLVVDLASPPLLYSSYKTGNKLVLAIANSPAAAENTGKAAGSNPGHGVSPSQGTVARVTFDFQEVDLRTIFEMLSGVSGLNIVSDQDVKGKVTLRMVNLPWDYILQVVLQSNSLKSRRVGNVIRVAPAGRFMEEQETAEQIKELRVKTQKELGRKARAQDRRQALVEKKAALELEKFVVKNVPISYLDPDDLATQLEQLKSEKPGASVTASIKTKSILIKDRKKNVDDMLKYISQLDVPTPQVAIEARIVEVNTDLTKDIGIQWGGRFSRRAGTFSIGGGLGVQEAHSTVRESPAFLLPTLPTGAVDVDLSGQNLAVNLPAAVGPGSGGAFNLTIGRLTDPFSLDIRLSLLEANAKVRILSAPRVVTLDNKKAVIRTGTQIPFVIATSSGPVTTFEDVDLVLEVVPHITPQKTVRLEIRLQNDQPLAEVPGIGPIIDQQLLTSEVLVNSGDTIVLGGIRVASDVSELTAVPGLHNIPVLGWLFKNKFNRTQQSEILLFITPRILESD
ncbi:MAG: type IV pilus secretin PilQ [Thermodesulfobacteriota bacterium]